MIEAFIYDAKAGRPVAWIANGDELYSVVTRYRFAGETRRRNALSGESTARSLAGG